MRTGFATNRIVKKVTPVLLLGLLCLGLPALAAEPSELNPHRLGGVETTTWTINLERYVQGAHGSLDCQICHVAQSEGILPGAASRHPDPSAPLYLNRSASRNYQYQDCRRCHRLSMERYEKGAHAKAMAQQKEKPPAPGLANLAPTCSDCHNSHYDKSQLGRVELGRRQVAVCGSCHPIQAQTYLANYHGMAAVNQGYDKAAYCSDCHGAHEVASLKDPKVALQACQRCHPNAKPNFAQVVIHPLKEKKAEPDATDKALAWRVGVIHSLTAIMIVVAILVVGFFYGHSFLWLLRELHEKIRKH
ncbi:MAG: cytochrome c family protein [Deltaproteobacteria bacterium]|nr:cytochrome c family protein [Deltaproteobacteria bacterium]